MNGDRRQFCSTLIAFIVLLGFSICPSSAQTTTNTPVRLTPAMFNDYELTLVSDKDYTYYLFLDDGRVESSFGQKNGGVVALGMGWKIKNGNTLVFLGIPPIQPPGGIPVENPERFTMQFRSFGKTMVVTMDGQKFKRSKFKRPN